MTSTSASESVLEQLREGVPDQELACLQLNLFQEAIKRESESVREINASSNTHVPDIAYLYGPPAAGKSKAAMLLALMLQSPLRTVCAAVLTDPQTELVRLQNTHSLHARCIRKIHVNVDKRKTAEPALQIADLFEQIRSEIDRVAEPAISTAVAASASTIVSILTGEQQHQQQQQQQHLRRDDSTSKLPPCVTLIFEELSQAPPAFVQPLMTLFEAGYVVVGGNKIVMCPLPLVILCLGNCPDEGSVLKSSQRPPTESELRAEVCAHLNYAPLNSRVVKLIVPFYPYRRSQLPAIARRLLEQMRPQLVQGVGVKVHASAFVFTLSLQRWVTKLLHHHNGGIRGASSQAVLSLRAAVNKVINSRRDRERSLSCWSAIYCIATADGRIVVQDQMLQSEVGV